jgi:RecA-family ATPase
VNELKRPKWLDERVLSLEQINTTDIPDIAWIVENLLTEGITVLAGMLKAGKSLLVVSIALAVAEGTLALNLHPVKQGRVLYVTPDDKQLSRLRTRIKLMRGGNTSPIPLDIATNWPNLDEGGIDELREYLDYYQDTQLVIYDVLMNVLPGISEDANAYDRIYQKLEPLKRLAQERHIAIVLVMHMNKGSGNGSSNPRSRIYGSMAYGAIADNILMLDEDYVSHIRYLMTSGKDLDQRRDALSFDAQTGVYSYSNEIVNEKRQDQRIAGYVLKHPGATRAEIIQWLVGLGVNRDTADKRVTRAKAALEIVNVPGRTGFYLPDDLPCEGSDCEDAA